MDIKQIFGRNVRRARTELGLTQVALSVKFGVDRAYVSAIERGVQNMTLVRAFELSEVLGVPLENLVAIPANVSEN